MPNVAIIGGGITGLTAGYLLKKKGIGVSIHDAQERPGGVIRTTRSGGFLAEHGPNSIMLTSPVIMELVGDLGLADRVCAPGDIAKNRFIVRGKKPLPLPGSPGSFLATPLFSPRAKLRLLLEPFIRRSPADADETLGDFVRRRIGREFLEYAINPFVAGVYAGDPERLSVRHSFPKLHALEQRYGSLIRGQVFGAGERKARAEKGKNDAGMISFDLGLQLLTDTLAERLGRDLKQRRVISALTRSAAGWHVDPGEDQAAGGGPPAAGGRATAFDTVLYAGSAHALSTMRIGNGAAADLSALSDIHYPPVSSLVLGFRRDAVGHLLDGFGVLVPEAEPFAILGALFSSSLFPGRAPEGHVTLTCFLGGTRRPETAVGETGELVETALRDLRKLLDVRGEPVFVHRAFYERAIPQYNVGYGRFLDAMSRAEAAHPGLFIAGNYRDGISLGNSIVSGHDVAGRIAEYLGVPR